MNIKEIEIDLKGSFFDFFENKIFHLIPNEDVLKKIMESKVIKHGRSEGCTHTTTHSSCSYGAVKEMVCVFNFESRNVKRILSLKAEDETIMDWLEGKMPNIYTYEYAIIFNSKINKKLITSQSEEEDRKYTHIPYIENWYNKNISIEFFEEIVKINYLFPTVKKDFFRIV